MDVVRFRDQYRRGEFKAGLVAVAITVVTGIITVISLREALRFGRLAIPPTYDDVVYFLDAARWLAEAPSRTLVANATALLAQHAPYATISAILGFTFVPNGNIGPYAINALVVAAFLAGVARMVWDLPTLHILTCVLGVASVPMLFQTLAEARPDLPWGLAMGLALTGIIRRPLIERSRRSLSILGVLVGLAVLVKPTALPASFACVAAAVSIALMRDALAHPSFELRHDVRHVITSVVLFGLCLAATIAPYVILQHKPLFSYIYSALVLNKDFWQFNGSLYEHAMFYATGNGGEIALWRFFWIGLVLFVVRLTVARRCGGAAWGQALCLLGVVTVAYIIPTLSAVKSYFLGAAFYGTFIVAMALNYAAIIRYFLSNKGPIPARAFVSPPNSVGGHRQANLTSSRAKLPFAALAGAVIVFAGATGLRWHIATRFDSATIQDAKVASRSVWSQVQRLQSVRATAAQSPLRVAFSSPYPVAPEMIKLQALAMGLQIEIDEAFFHRTVQEAVEHLERADLIVVTASIPHNLPGPRNGDEIMRALDATTSICATETQALANVREMKIYTRSDGNCSMKMRKEDPDVRF